MRGKMNPVLKKGETFEFTLPISKQRISDLLVSAFEGGSNYWGVLITQYIHPSEFVSRTEADPDHFSCEHGDYPLTKDGAVLLNVDYTDAFYQREGFRLDFAAIQAGLKVFAEKCPSHFADWISDADDATTADCFLQCCIYGAVVFG